MQNCQSKFLSNHKTIKFWLLKVLYLTQKIIKEKSDSKDHPNDVNFLTKTFTEQSSSLCGLKHKKGQKENK